MHADVCVSGAVLEGSQCCFVIESSLLWHTTVPPPLFPIPVPHLLRSSYCPFLHAVPSSYLTFLHWQLWYCLSLSTSYLLHQQRVSSSPTRSWQPRGVQWTEERVQWNRECHITEKTWGSFSVPILIKWRVFNRGHCSLPLNCQTTFDRCLKENLQLQQSQKKSRRTVLFYVFLVLRVEKMNAVKGQTRKM